LLAAGDAGAEGPAAGAQEVNEPGAIFRKYLEAHPHGEIACFGARETPEPILDLMERLGEMLTRRGWKLRSGHAVGADYAWEKGAHKGDPMKMTVCLPFWRYNSELPMPARAVAFQSLGETLRRRFIAEAKAQHPAYDRLPPGARLMLNRNAMIADGTFLGLCWLDRSKPGGGGSGHTARILQGRGCPVLDLGDGSGWVQEWLKEEAH
jgi:hypothetical protein